MSNTRAIHPSSHNLDLQQNGDSNGCQVVGSYITVHQGQNVLSLGCAAAVQGEGIGIAQDGDQNNTCVMGFEHEIIQSGHQNQAFVLGGQGNRVTQNGFASRVHILNGNFKYNRVLQCGMGNEADLQGHGNRLSQDGGPAALIRGNRNKVRQHGLDNVACIGHEQRKAHRNSVLQTGNQNLARVRGHQNLLRTRGYANVGTVLGHDNSLAIQGEGNRVMTRGSGNQVAVKGEDICLKVRGDNFNLKVKGCGIRGTFQDGTFIPAPGCPVEVNLSLLETGGAPLHLLSVEG